MLFYRNWHIPGKLRESEEDKPLVSSCFSPPSLQGCGVERGSSEDTAPNQVLQGTHSIYESGSPAQSHPLTQKPPVTLLQTEGGSLPIFHIPTQSFFSSFSSAVSFMFSFSFSPVHASSLDSSSILVKQIPFRGQSLSVFLTKQWLFCL